MILKDLNIDRHWTLFLDRDGTINRIRVDDYVKRWDEFEFLPGVLEAIPLLNTLFGILIIVSNQQGIGKGMVEQAVVEEVHGRMLDVIRQAKGEIHGIYYCPYLESDHHPCRKPNPGMAYQAQKDFPRIEFSKSVMVGDFKSDMEFGRRLGMVNVLITADPAGEDMDHSLYDFTYPDLLSFTKGLKK